MARTGETGRWRGTARDAGLKARSEHTQTRRRARADGTGGAANPNHAPLSRERIVAAALRIVAAADLPGLTYRRLAEALGCEAMSVYHYFPSKQHLLDAMVEHALAGIREPAAELDPIDGLRFIGREYRAMALRHPSLFPLIALRRLNMPLGVVFIERMLRHFHAALPDDRLAAQAFRIFGYYVIGAALDETAGYAAGPSAAEPVAEDFIARECPRLAAAAPFFKPAHFESTFELGFEWMLKGIAELRAGLMASARHPPKPVVRPKA